MSKEAPQNIETVKPSVLAKKEEILSNCWQFICVASIYSHDLRLLDLI